ncbi:heme exporter protein CcmD [Candidatus Njordibacter sp. Uisw_002]|jgi:heme exporter protein D|uniref:heme exporter protein CcmD n=1 Tax=Candidatus Njordibacter sp. Uisw_002 TaxID=3230971 RepID=UPI003D4035AA
MYFESVGELWRMAGHGPYVWSCYGLFMVLLAVNVLHARSERLSALKQAKAFIRRNRN